MEPIQKLQQQAIDAAFNNQWQEAINLNKKILKIDKKNLEAILRLGFAYFQQQEYEKAKKIYKKGLKIQPNNPVILNYLKKIGLVEKKKEKNNSSSYLADPELFLEIPGKTKSVNLVNLGQKKVLAKLNIGQPLILNIKRRRIIIKNKENEFVGSLPDDIGKRLILLIKGGNKYACFVKDVSLNHLVVFLKEEEKSNKMRRFISFPLKYNQNISKMIEQVGEEEVAMKEEELIDDDSEMSENADIEELAKELTEEKEEDYFYFSPSNDEDEFEEE